MTPSPPNKKRAIGPFFIWQRAVGTSRTLLGSTSGVRETPRRTSGRASVPMVPRRNAPRDGGIAIRRDRHNPSFSANKTTNIGGVFRRSSD